MSLEQANFDGKRPLHDAAQFSQFKCVEYLISQGKHVPVISLNKNDKNHLDKCLKTYIYQPYRLLVVRQ